MTLVPIEVGADAKWHNRLGSLLSASHKYAEAIRHFEQALDHAPRYAAAHFNLASAIVFAKGASVGRPLDVAIDHFRQAIAIQPHFPDAHVNLAAQLYAHGNLHDALRHATTALHQDPDNTHAYYNLNTIYRALGQQDRAVDLCWHRILSSLPVGTSRPSLRRPQDSQPEESYRSSMTHLTVVCVKWGVKYGAEYVNKLHRGVARHLKSVRYTFCCLTDNAVGLAPEIDVRLLAPGWVGWWNKAQVFSPAFGWTGRMLYLDLDSVLVGSLDDLALV
ncbi:hypothetical protein, variant [Aphanomyces invadans]|uniref:Uncharacterized protein n=1 Tax=Aphanomyces invadans TaxID=157072 RepID=A0A024TYN5_9STRA|nr:hypothetical protein, variant [Aphanomyces invadans]ETV98746.1 hypothetical protein, variant [Aphanomyces invadans]|eukprot:XP_008872943.1 hypothetical protein, variant [Aphanomyces invadans]